MLSYQVHWAEIGERTVAATAPVVVNLTGELLSLVAQCWVVCFFLPLPVVTLAQITSSIGPR